MSEIFEKTLAKDHLPGKRIIHNDSHSQILSTLIHELRNPVAILTSNIELLRKFNYNIDNKITSETFHLCEEAIKAMMRFIDDISFLHRSDKGELEAVCKEFDIAGFFDHLHQEFPDSSFNRGRIRYEGSFDTEIFCTDPQLLSLIIKNLISNALKFSSEEVFLGIECSKDELNVKVKDHGMGILPGETDLLFEPFFRGSNVKMISGSGLGLAIVKRSVDLLNGTIDIATLMDQGTTFNIKILNNGCQKNIDH